MKKLKAYFAHAHYSETHGAAIVTLHFLRKGLPEVEIMNPFDHDLTESWLKNPQSKTIAKAIVRKDLEMIQDCDFIITYLPRMIGETKYDGSFGTAMEIWYSRMELNKTVYALCGIRHPWLLALNIKMEEDLDTLIQLIRSEWQL